MDNDDRNEHPTSEAPDAAEPGGIRRRFWVTAVGGLAIVVAAGWLAGSLGLLPAGGAQTPSSTEPPAADEARVGDAHRITDLAELPPGPTDHVEVAYFHRTHRCWSCTEAERLTSLALDTHFADDVANGRLSFVVTDVEQPENADVAARYEAWGSSLYLGVSKAGTTYIHPVSDIWFAISDEGIFVELLREKIAIALGD